MTRIRITLVALGTFLVLCFYAEMIAHAPATGQDFRNFYAAASLVRRGGNPYDQRQFLREEERLYRPASAGQVAAMAGNPYVQGPLLAIALMAILDLPPNDAYAVWAAFLAAALVATVALLSRLWPTHDAVRRGFTLLISPVAFLGLLLGQPDAVLVLLLALSCWLLYHRHPMAAGLALTPGLIKPQIIAGPVLILALLAWQHRRLSRYALGLLSGSAAFVGTSLAIVGPATLGSWAAELVGFGGTAMYGQVDISSLTTLYVAWAPHGAGSLLSLALLVVWAVASMYLWRGLDPAPSGPMNDTAANRGYVATSRRARPAQTFAIAAAVTEDAAARSSRAVVGHADDGEPNEATPTLPSVRSRLLGISLPEHWWLSTSLTLWLLVTPYAHPHDDVLLLPAIWYLFGTSDRGRAERLWTALFFVAWWLLPTTSLLGLRPPLIRGLGIVPVAVLAIVLVIRRPTPGSASRARASQRFAA